jgi:hypothetical protein
MVYIGKSLNKLSLPPESLICIKFNDVCVISLDNLRCGIE